MSNYFPKIFRGGGPFGIGRGVSLDELENDLLEALKILQKDSHLSTSGQEQQSIAGDEQNVLKHNESINKNESERSSIQLQSYKNSSLPSFQNRNNQLEMKTSEQVPLSEGLRQFLTNPSSLQINELNALRDSTIEALFMISNELRNRKSIGNEAKEGSINRRFMKDHYEVPDKSDAEKDIQTALGLLMKHKGGAGMGHGRLAGEELEMMESMLRKTVEYFKC